jgi:endonuclease/exonuclease/phosphatase family metal-dependent hydrolase
MRALGLLVVVACASNSESTLPIPEGAPRLRVMTYNVNFGLVGDAEGVAAVASASPDIVVLQETNDAWEQAFRSLPFAHRRFEGPQNEWAAAGMGVLSKYPIRSIDHLDSDAGPFFAWRIVIEAPGGPVQILNVHLHPPMDRASGSWVVGYFSTGSIRAKEATDHVAKLADMPTIVAGDFNEEDEGRAIAIFRKRNLTSALPQFQPDADTWQWEVGSSGTTLRFRLDHILYDKRAFRAIAADVVGRGHSDHAPVWADLVRLR